MIARARQDGKIKTHIIFCLGPLEIIVKRHIEEGSR